MGYKTILLNTETYNKVRNAKNVLSARFKQKLSFGGLFEEIFGKNIEFLNIDEGLLDYIRSFCNRIQEEDYVLGILLFGSVAKGSYNKYSDIDLLIVISHEKYAAKVIDRIHVIKKELREAERGLIAKRLPMFVSPLVLDKDKLSVFKPIYLDFLDYGIVLFERHSTITEFLDSLRKIKHRRTFKPYEMLTWQRLPR